jgi:pyruvate-ferredoxin/flavodoxin oxidoreductase
MELGVTQRREKVADLIRQAVGLDLPTDLREAFQQWLDHLDDGDASKEYGRNVVTLVNRELSKPKPPHKELLCDILNRKDYLTKKSVWVIGGDGWAYDIGYGGLDHVMAIGRDVNVLVLDTEVYSNTGGQSSKSTPVGAVAKFAAGGKATGKKDLGMMAMTYGYVYVASVAMGANKNQFLKTVLEAESYRGPSLIIAYAPCINHGINMGKSQEEEKRAVEAGYWFLYRYDPRLKAEGKNPFLLDSKEPKGDFKAFLNGEIRYSALTRIFPENAEVLFERAERQMREKYEMYRQLAGGPPSVQA